ncbi:hypothetical protein ACHQM5_023366 [Ranunculus cassubicifolius]
MSNGRDAPSFFKVLVGDFKNKLCLPKALRMKLNDNGKILLRNPTTRRSWLVSVKEDESDLFLCNEWTNFANDNDLQFAEFLVFRSSGESEFTVKIFGRNGCEKEFPSGMENNEETQGEETELHPGTQHNIGQDSKTEAAALINKMSDLGMKDTGNEVEETGRTLTTTFQKSSRYHFYLPRWWVKKTSLDEKDRVTLLDPSDKPWPVDIVRRGVGHTFLGKGWSEFCTAYRLNTSDTFRLQFVDENTIRVEITQRKVDSSDIPIEEANEKQRRETIVAMTGFTSDNPYCSVTMRSSYVGANFTLCLPTLFARTFIKEDHRDVILRGSNGGSWITRYANQTTHYTLGKGWRKFVSDNNLKENDVCIFELVNRDQMELKVSIIPHVC